MNLTIPDMIHAGDFAAAVARMRYLSRLGDPTEQVDVAAVREAFEASRTYLRSVVPPEPFRIVVEVIS